MNAGGWEDGWWMELAQDHIAWQDLVAALLELGDSTSRDFGS